ncbi:MAG: toll/interleukin-1 receptor domain-containing protein [Fibromonadaceae bacterium]|nr:toll/interleukin-1 receptor domain-containing protein [Fibromonadaceae bacterium]
MKYRIVSENEVKNIWAENHFRIFLSHKSAYKEKVSKLKQELKKYYIGAFVAHNDIEPSKEWQDEIEKALLSMNAFVALITKDFYDGDGEWTNQEIGFSTAFDIPRIYVNLGGNPRGFAAKFQALKCSWDEAPEKIFSILSKYDNFRNAFVDNLIGDLKNVLDFLSANEFYDRLITFNLSEEQCDKVIFAYNNNVQIGKNYRFKSGIISYLNKWSSKQYKLDEANKIV